MKTNEQIRAMIQIVATAIPHEEITAGEWALIGASLKITARAVEERQSAAFEKEKKAALEAARVCSCVRKNAELGIEDCIQQEKAGRAGVGAGIVYETTSALRACPICKGTGYKS